MQIRPAEIIKMPWKYRSSLLLFVTIFSCLFGDNHTLSQPAATLDMSRLQLTFDEEFDSLNVSPWGPNTRWIAHTPWAGDFGDAIFADPILGVFPFTLDNGILRIEAKKRADGTWESGLLASADSNGKGFSQRYGYFEMRAKLPKGKGVWPAFWLSTIADPKASSFVEFDVLEFYGHAPDRYQSAVHTWYLNEADKKPQPPLHFTTVPINSLSDSFNTFGILLRRDFVIFYLNRSEIWREKTPSELNRPLLILLNLALGSGFPIDETPNPSYMYVDYVRAYSERD
jgi:beta-glucanase (GH16 family)